MSILHRHNAGLQRVVLDNGMIVLLKEDHSAPVAAIQIWVGTGSIHEENFLGGGLSHAMEHMVFKGTARRKLGDITREINDAGGEVNAYTSLDRTVFLADLPASRWTVGLDVLADAVMHASFPDTEWTKERDVILREFAMGNDEPDNVLAKRLWSTAYQAHPYRHPVIGHEDVFRTITANDLRVFFRRHYVPDNMITVVVGDIQAREAETAIRQAFAGFQRRGRAPVVLPPEPRQMAPRLTRQTGRYNIARLEWAYHTVGLSHPDTPALDVLAEIVGRSRGSRLNARIMEDLRLVTAISAGSFTPKDPGMFTISASFDPGKESAVIAAIQAEIDSWSTTPFTEAEILKVRRALLLSQLAELRTMNGQASSYASGEFYAGDPRFSETYLRLLQQVTPHSVQDVTRRHLRPENRTLAVLSPISEPVAAGDDAAPASTVYPTRKITIPGGAVLLVREDHRLPFVHFCAAIGGGLLSETATNNGITQLTADLLTRGTRSRSAEDIAKTTEELGAELNSFSGQNSFGLQAECLSADAHAVLNIFTDCLRHPEFPEREIGKQKDVQISAIQAQKEDPFFQARQGLRQLLFPDHPYQWDILGSAETVGKLTREELIEHHRRLLLGGNVVLAVFGDIAIADAQAMVERLWNDLHPGAPPVLPPLSSASRLPARCKQREPREQAILLAGFPGVSIKDRRADPLNLLKTALNGLSSELSMRLREELGLVYFAGAFQQVGAHPGAFVFYAGSREDTVPAVEDVIRREIRRITTTGITPAELERARRQVITESQQDLQDNARLAMQCAVSELLGMDFMYPFTVKERFEKITADQVRDAAVSIISTNRMAISIVLPQPNDTNPRPGAGPATTPNH